MFSLMLLGRSRCFSGRRSLVSGLESMGEHELVDLLSQYEADEKFGGNLSPSLTSKMVTTYIHDFFITQI